MDWNTVFTTLTVTGFASAAFVYLAKILSKHLLSMDLERFKADLKATNEKELERLRADLRIAAFQQETTFAKLHGKRAEVIAELYVKLVAVHDAMKSLIGHTELDNEPQRDKKAVAAAHEFFRYYEIHQIYLEESLCELLVKFDHDILLAWGAYNDNPPVGKVGLVGREMMASWQQLDRQIPPIRREIERTFRKVLGLPPSSITPSKAG